MGVTPLPGDDLIRDGMDDLRRRAETVPAVNALIRRLVSYQRAAECAGGVVKAGDDLAGDRRGP